MAIATSVAVTGSGAVGPTTGGTLVYGWNFAENAGSPAAARVLLRDGGAGGAIIGDIRLAASQSAGTEYTAPIRCTSTSGFYVEVNAGTVRGAAYIAPAER